MKFSAALNWELCSVPVVGFGRHALLTSVTVQENSMNQCQDSGPNAPETHYKIALCPPFSSSLLLFNLTWPCFFPATWGLLLGNSCYVSTSLKQIFNVFVVWNFIWKCFGEFLSPVWHSLSFWFRGFLTWQWVSAAEQQTFLIFLVTVSVLSYCFSYIFRQYVFLM